MPLYILKNTRTNTYYVEHKFVGGFLAHQSILATPVEHTRIDDIKAVNATVSDDITCIPYHNPDIYAALINARNAVNLANQYMNKLQELDVFNHISQLDALAKTLANIEVTLSIKATLFPHN